MPQAALGITSISPVSGPSTGGTVVTISGYGFKKSTGIKFGGVVSPKVVLINSTLIYATTPSMPAGTVTVSVTGTNRRTTLSDPQSAILSNAFTFVGGPVILTVNPSSGPSAGGTLVSIAGSGLDSASTVLFDNVPAVISDSSNAPSQLIVVAPAGVVGNADIRVVAPDGQFSVAAGAYTYTGAVVSIGSVSPATGTASGGTTVTIFGSGFVSGATVDFGANPGTGVIFVSSSELQVTSPAHAAGAVDIVVTNPDNSTATLTNGFSYTAAAYLFSDDFEGRDMSKWSSYGYAVQSAIKNNGSYAAQGHYVICGDSSNPACGAAVQDNNVAFEKVYDTVGIPEIFVRGCFRIQTPEAGASHYLQRKLFYFTAGCFGCSMFPNGDPWSIIVGTWQTNPNQWGALGPGPMYMTWALQNTPIGGSSSMVWPDSFTGPALAVDYDTFYSLELRVKYNTALTAPWNGEVQIWIDGTSVYNAAGWSLNRQYNNYHLRMFRFGCQANRDNYDIVNEYRQWDDIVLATSYIGPPA